MNDTSVKVTPGQLLTPSQTTGLKIVSSLHQGRDVVLAIDMTESVGLNDEGRNFEGTDNQEDQKCKLPNNERIAIGHGEDNSTCVDSINCPGAEVRAYLERKGEKFYLVPTNSAPIFYNSQQITSRTPIASSRFKINCPDPRYREYEIVIQVKK